MSLALLGDLNWLAVLVGALAYFAIGGLWYAPPVFGNLWMRSIGWEPTEDEGPGPEFFIGPAVTCLVATTALAMVATATDATTIADGIGLGLVAGIGIAGSALFVTGYFDPIKPAPMRWFAITGGYHLVGMLVASIIVSVWR